VRRWLLAAAVALGPGCDLFGDTSTPASGCIHDSDCPSGQSCFVDGCGAMPGDLVAEVTTSAPLGVTSVDVPLGVPHADLPLILPGAQLLQLSVRRGASSYPGRVQILVSGQSVLLPGVSRTAQTSGAEVSGTYKLGVSTGRYSVSVTPADPTVPPGARTGVAVDAGQTLASFDLPPAAGVQTLAGTVLAGPGQPEPVPPDVQLLAADGRPLSSRKTADPSGAFQLSTAVDALDGGALLQVTPAAGTLGAVASFAVSAPARFSQPFLVGDAVAPIQVSGTLLGPDGSPVSGATVLVQGKVSGGGSGNVGPAVTASDGSFSLLSLPQAGPGTLELWAVPPPGSAAGLLRTALDAPAGSPVSGTWSCPARPLLQGTALLPDGGALAGSAVRADPVAAADPATPLPPAGGSGQTDTSGRFLIRLDPAEYRLEVAGTDSSPVLRRFVLVPPTGDQLEPFSLATGRRLTARVARDGGAVVPQALVRVYRQGTLEDGTPRALLLGEGVSDEHGVVTILLPVR